MCIRDSLKAALSSLKERLLPSEELQKDNITEVTAPPIEDEKVEKGEKAQGPLIQVDEKSQKNFWPTLKKLASSTINKGSAINGFLKSESGEYVLRMFALPEFASILEADITDKQLSLIHI
eukprot:TRINITY_DN13388_c0_g3_i1.p1 TRINITY_DN13388_c0_g3~~TRINITY_DN13388_c0_g3_i1.p1  ORF type:complete len:141 (-),score=46.21 TRINITY_DN13388_c0_g3_i1:60-422(-)